MDLTEICRNILIMELNISYNVLLAAKPCILNKRQDEKVKNKWI